MGRSSRRKKEKRNSLPDLSALPRYKRDMYIKFHNALNGPAKIAREHDPNHIPKDLVIYRFFDEEIYANNFVEGSLRISTLKKCRTKENSLQGDKEEAVHTHYSGSFDGSGAEAIQHANRLGMPFFPNDARLKLNNNTVITSIEDAYLLCMTARFDPNNFEKDFGKFCVEIYKPRKLFFLIDEELRKNSSIKASLWGCVRYQERISIGLQGDASKIGFVKPPLYQSQNEIRFLWLPENSKSIDVLDIKIQNCSSFCRRIL